jgi:hypothetical protein
VSSQGCLAQNLTMFSTVLCQKYLRLHVKIFNTEKWEKKPTAQKSQRSARRLRWNQGRSVTEHGLAKSTVGRCVAL